jgi:Glycosyl hydrolase family 76
MSRGAGCREGGRVLSIRSLSRSGLPSQTIRSHRALLALVLLQLACGACLTIAWPAPRAAWAASGPDSARVAGDSSFLTLAERGVRIAWRRWFDRRREWFEEDIGDRAPRQPASLWGVVPLFEALDAVAEARPSTRNLRALRIFARGAERYWNPRARGYGPYPGDRSRRIWVDDNGWWGLAFFDAYRVAGDRRYLKSARRAFRFMATEGWARSGGLWWDTTHSFKAGESLASASLLAADLYSVTGKRFYRQQFEKFVAWGDRGLWNPSARLYTRSDRDSTPLSYVEGPLIAASATICDATGDAGACERAEDLAHSARAWFGDEPHMGPQYDAIYLRCLLLLSTIDGDREWYELAQANALRALESARSGPDLYLKTWDGDPKRPDRSSPLQTHASTVSLFAWLAATPPPQ